MLGQINTKIQSPLSISILLLLFLGTWQTVHGSQQSRETDVVKAVRHASPAVVNISSQYEIRKNSNPFSGYGMDPMFEKFFREFFSPEFQRRQKRTSLGSGVIIDGDRGFVLTNTHVVDRATMINVTLNDEQDFEAELVGMDPDSDLAVLKIQSDEPLPSIQMGNSDDLMIGESVIAIGNPFGFSHTVTTGVVSAVKRSVKTDDRVFHEFIQTDASINPGNSGGPLLNIDGELIGINTAIHAQAQGIGFAIPINRAKRIVSDLINYGEVVDAWVGLIIHPIDAKLADYLNIPKDGGVIVGEVESHSPAEAAGFQEGDIVIAVEGQSVTDITSYLSKMKAIGVNQTLSFKVIRKGEAHRIKLTTTIFPLDQALALAKQRLGITVSDLDPDTRNTYGIRSRLGVLIMEMRRGSHLNRIGVRPGDIIRQIGGTQVNNINDFKSAIVKHRNKKSVVILIERDGHLYHINTTLKAT